MIKIILLTTWIVYALLEGKRDGYYYCYRNTSNQLKGENIHWIYFTDRFILMSLITWVHSWEYPILNTGIFALSLILLFSFFHNGKYYRTRKKLSHGEIYPKGWWDMSISSEALLNLTPVSRTWLAVTGLIGIIATCGLKI